MRQSVLRRKSKTFTARCSPVRITEVRMLCAAAPGAFAVRQPQLFVEQRENRMRVRPELTGRRAACGGCLHRMSALHQAAVIATGAHVDVEAAADHVARNLGLILRVDVRFVDAPAAAVRTVAWHVSFSS